MPTEYEEVAELANALRKSPLFAKRGAANDAKLLDHLIKYWQPGMREHLTASAIAKEVLNTTQDRRGHAAARQAIHRLRGHLDSFYREGEGRKSPRCLRLLPGVPYLLEPAPHEEAFDALDDFWDPYFIGTFPNVVVWAEPLVYVDSDLRAYVRFLDSNCEESDPDRLAEMKPPATHSLATQSMVPCFHYQSSGDIAAVHAIQSWFQKREVEITPRVTRETTNSAVVEANAIIVGNMRTNRYIKRLQSGLDFVVEADRVVIKEPDAALGQKDKYLDYHPSSELNQGGVEGFAYAVLSRLPNDNERAFATLIAANHGRAIQKVADYLVIRSSMSHLFEDRFRPTQSLWPKTFQVLFQVKIGRGMVFQDAVPIHHRIYDEA